MKVKVLGCGNAFSSQNFNQMFLLQENGRKMLIDCGYQAQAALNYHKIPVTEIDDIYISHQHADHIGCLEYVAFTRYDWVSKPEKAKDFVLGKAPHLICETKLMEHLWDDSLRGGLESMEGFTATLDTYFITHPIKCRDGFKWEGWQCTPVQQVHVMTGSEFMYAFGLMMEKKGHKSVYFTTDSQHCSPKQVTTWYEKADIIFQDCELTGILSGVHANYIELAGYAEANNQKLSDKTKGKMWLSHYHDWYNKGLKQVVKSPSLPFYQAPAGQKDFMSFIPFDWDRQAKVDGFAGFVQMGQEFEF